MSDERRARICVPVCARRADELRPFVSRAAEVADIVELRLDCLDEDQLDTWLVNGAERFRADAPVSAALLALAKHDDSRRCLLLLHQILQTPQLVDRLSDALGRTDDRGQESNGGRQ